MAKTEKKKAAPKKPKLPLPEGVPAVKGDVPKAVRRAESAHLTPLPPRGEASTLPCLSTVASTRNGASPTNLRQCASRRSSCLSRARGLGSG